MEEDPYRYDSWIEAALRNVIAQALNLAASHGLSGDHHFYISFLTQEDGVVIPPQLRAQHPEEMTIVLQHQFENLKIDDDAFSVSLRFNGKLEHLHIPFSAVLSFTDPGVNFGLQLKMIPAANAPEDGEEPATVEEAPQHSTAKFKPQQTKKDGAEPDGKKEKPGQVITLDAFRKK